MLKLGMIAFEMSLGHDHLLSVTHIDCTQCWICSKLLQVQYTKKLGIFNWSRDYSRSKKSTETSWSSAQHQITVNQLKLLYPYCALPFFGMKAQ